jgi:hypothetical protein
MRLVGGEVFGRPLGGGAVHPQLRGDPTPVLDAALRVGQIEEHLAGEEVAPHVLHGSLDPGLVLGRAHPRGVGAEPAGLGVVQPPGAEGWVDRVGVDHHRLEVVRDQHLEHPAEERPRRLAAGDHVGQRLPQRQPHEHVPRHHRGEDQRVHRPAPPRPGVEHQPELAEVELALHPRITVSDAQRGPAAPEAASLHREAVQRAIRHGDAAAFELAVDVGQLQLLADPAGDLVLHREQPLPRRTVTLAAFRPHGVDHRADQLVGQLLQPAFPDHAELDRGLDVTPRGLAVDTGPLSDRPKAELATDPVP